MDIPIQRCTPLKCDPFNFGVFKCFEINIWNFNFTPILTEEKEPKFLILS